MNNDKVHTSPWEEEYEKNYLENLFDATITDFSMETKERVQERLFERTQEIFSQMGDLLFQLEIIHKEMHDKNLLTGIERFEGFRIIHSSVEDTPTQVCFGKYPKQKKPPYINSSRYGRTTDKYKDLEEPIIESKETTETND